MTSLKVRAAAAKRVFVQLHRGEQGMETVQIIMIMAVAAMVLTGVNAVTGTSTAAGEQPTGLLGTVVGGISNLFGVQGGSFLGDGLGSLIGGLF